MPLLLRNRAPADFDRVIATVCSPSDAASQRLLARGLTRGATRDQRLAAQMPGTAKRQRAPTSSIRTDGTFEETDAQVDERLVEALRSLSARCLYPPSPSARNLPLLLDLHLRRVLRRRDPLFDERVPVVAMRALPEQLGAAVAAAHADVRVEIEHGVLRQLAVAVDQCGRMAQLRRAPARSPDGCCSACGFCTSAANSRSSASCVCPLAAQWRDSASRAAPVLRVLVDQPPAETREALGRRPSRIASASRRSNAR